MDLHRIIGSIPGRLFLLFPAIIIVGWGIDSAAHPLIQLAESHLPYMTPFRAVEAVLFGGSSLWLAKKYSYAFLRWGLIGFLVSGLGLGYMLISIFAMRSAPEELRQKIRNRQDKTVVFWCICLAILICLFSFLAFVSLPGEYATNVYMQDQKGTTPLHRAAVDNNTDAAIVLLDAGADINVQGKDGSTLLHWAAIHNNTDMAIAFLGAGADVNARSKYGATPLHIAAIHDNAGGMIAAFIDAGADVNVQDEDGTTPLHLAASVLKKPKTSVVRALIVAGADVNSCALARTFVLSSLFCLSPLYYAIMTSSDPKIIEEIKAAGSKDIDPLLLPTLYYGKSLYE